MLGGGAAGQQPGSAQQRAGPSGRQARPRQPTAQVIDDALPELEELPEDVAAHWRSVIMWVSALCGAGWVKVLAVSVLTSPAMQAWACKERGSSRWLVRLHSAAIVKRSGLSGVLCQPSSSSLAVVMLCQLRWAACCRADRERQEALGSQPLSDLYLATAPGRRPGQSNSTRPADN